MADYRNRKLGQGCRVFVVDGRVDQALRTFKNKIQDSGLILELREREAYEKPTTKRKRALSRAKKRWQTKLANEALPKRLY